MGKQWGGAGALWGGPRDSTSTCFMVPSHSAHGAVANPAPGKSVVGGRDPWASTHVVAPSPRLGASTKGGLCPATPCGSGSKHQEAVTGGPDLGRGVAHWVSSEPQAERGGLGGGAWAAFGRVLSLQPVQACCTTSPGCSELRRDPTHCLGNGQWGQAVACPLAGTSIVLTLHLPAPRELSRGRGGEKGPRTGQICAALGRKHWKGGGGSLHGVCPLALLSPCSSKLILPYHYSASNINPGSWGLRQDEVRGEA